MYGSRGVTRNTHSNVWNLTPDLFFNSKRKMLRKRSKASSLKVSAGRCFCPSKMSFYLFLGVGSLLVEIFIRSIHSRSAVVDDAKSQLDIIVQ